MTSKTSKIHFINIHQDKLSHDQYKIIKMIISDIINNEKYIIRCNNNTDLGICLDKLPEEIFNEIYNYIYNHVTLLNQKKLH